MNEETGTKEEDLRYFTCPLCEATCGLEARVENGRVTRVRGDQQDVFSKGFICAKGSVIQHLHDDPDRLRMPQIKQADGTHKDATWDEAFAEIARLLVPSREQHGAGSTGTYIGNPNVHGPALFTLGMLSGSMGSPNLFAASSVDQLAREVANGLMYGDTRSWGVPDLDRTDLLVIIGANPVVSGGSLATAPDWPGRIDAIRERGGRVVVIDPRKTETAAKADDWWGIRPGTDALLLAAIAQVVFSEGLANLGSAADYCDNLDLVAEALNGFTPEHVSTATGLDPSNIRDLARRLAASERAVVYGRVGLQTHAFGTMASWLTDIVNIVTGHLDTPGGVMFATPAAEMPFDPSEHPDGFTIGRWHSRVHGYPECRGELPTATIADEILLPGEGQIRSFICLAGNPVRSCPDSNRLEEAFASLDCLVSVDIYRNETSRHAHVILPPPGPLERSHYDYFFYPMAVRNVANWSPPVFPAQGPAEEDIHLRLTGLVLGMGPNADLDVLRSGLLSQLATVVAVGADPNDVVAGLDGDTAGDKIIDLLLKNGPYEDLSLAALQAKPHGVDLGPLRPQLPARLRTPNRRINLLPSLIAEDLSRLVDLATEAPAGMLMIGRRQLRSNNSWMHNVRILMKGKPRCTLQINSNDAQRLGIDDGDAVTVTNAVGSLVAPAEVTDSLVPGVVSLPHGWGHDVEGQTIATAQPGVNSNVLTDPTKVDPLSGTCSINAIPVTLSS